MASSETATPAKGLWAPALTALDEDLAPDPGRTVAHVRRLLDEGCHGGVLFGTTGLFTGWVMSGMEVALVTFLVLATAVARLRGASVAVGVLGALASLLFVFGKIHGQLV